MGRQDEIKKLEVIIYAYYNLNIGVQYGISLAKHLINEGYGSKDRIGGYNDGFTESERHLIGAYRVKYNREVKKL